MGENDCPVDAHLLGGRHLPGEIPLDLGAEGDFLSLIILKELGAPEGQQQAPALVLFSL